MCGICGHVSLSLSSDADSTIVEQMINRMLHRGPDSTGMFTNRHASVGMCRLSLVDLSGGDQPIFNEDKTLAIVMNGEIYNFRELRSQLQDRHVFLTNTDTEVVLHLFEDVGPGVFNRLEGMFAVCILHIPTGSAWIARDYFGIKPLYWACDSKHVAFSSELTSLCSAFASTGPVSDQALGEFFTFGYVRGSQSIFSNVKRLTAGHYLRIANGVVDEVPFYNPLSLLKRAVSISEKDAVNEIERLLSCIVPSYQAADVPVAAFLSGGVDSSLICRFMKGNEPSTYSMSFNDSSFHDESAYASIVARIIESKHKSITMNSPDFSSILRIISCFGEPFADSSAIPTYLVSKEISKEVKAALSGDGADEIFMGYSLFQGASVAKCLSYMPFKGLTAKALRALSGIGGSRREVMDTIARRIEHACKPLTRQLLDKQSMFSMELNCQSKCLSVYSQQCINECNCFAEHLEILHMQSVSLLTRLAYMQLILNLPSGILTKIDRTAMANSLEVRIPYLDRRIVNFAFSIPEDLKLHRLHTKYILRKLAAKHFPNSISNRAKHGFTVPLLQWFAGALGEDLMKMMDDSAAGDAGLINPKAVIETVLNHRSGAVNASSTLYSMLVIEQWARVWL